MTQYEKLCELATKTEKAKKRAEVIFIEAFKTNLAAALECHEDLVHVTWRDPIPEPTAIGFTFDVCIDLINRSEEVFERVEIYSLKGRFSCPKPGTESLALLADDNAFKLGVDTIAASYWPYMFSKAENKFI